jgi:hypothetical protein
MKFKLNSPLKTIDKMNKKADYDSTQYLLNNSTYTGVCDWVSPASPIYTSSLIKRHYKFVHSVRICGVVLVYLLEHSVAEKAGSGNVTLSKKKSTQQVIYEELLLLHYELKKEILDDFMKKSLKFPVSRAVIERSIHKTLFSKYKSLLDWIKGMLDL